MSRNPNWHNFRTGKRLRLEPLEPRRLLSGTPVGPVVESAAFVDTYRLEVRFADAIDAASFTADDVAITASLPPTSWTPVLGDVEAACVAGDLLFAAMGERGLGISKVEYPSQAYYSNPAGTTQAAYDVEVTGDRAYVADYRNGLEVYNVADPSAPVLVGTYETWGAQDVEIFGNGETVALGLGTNGVAFVSVADPADPVLLSEFDTPDFAGDVEIAGNRAYVADDASGVLVLDISDLQTPQLVGSYDTSGHVRDVELVGTTLYAADKDGGLVILDVTSDSPSFLGSYTDCDWVLDVDLDGDTAFLAARKDGMVILNVSDPAAPELVGTFDEDGYASEVEVAEEILLLSDEGGPCRVFQRIVGVDHIETTGPDAFDVVLDRPLENGDAYQVTIGPNVSDPAGNGMDSDGDGTAGEPEDAFVATLILPYIPGDLNQDGNVNSSDLDVIRAHWGETVTPGDLLSGDGSGDGLVNSDDLNLVRANWGYGYSSAAVESASPAEALTTTEMVYGPAPEPEKQADSTQRNDPRNNLALSAWLTEVDARRAER